MAGMDYITCDKCGARLWYAPNARVNKVNARNPKVICDCCVRKLEKRLERWEKRLKRRESKLNRTRMRIKGAKKDECNESNTDGR